MSAQVLPQASSYLDIIIKFEIGFGFAFELPVVVFYLVIFDIIPTRRCAGSGAPSTSCSWCSAR